MNARAPTSWSPDDPAYWQDRGKLVAHRHLWISVPNLLVGFAVWMIWSVAVVMLPEAGFPFSPIQLFGLVSAPGLAAAILRLLYGLAAARIPARSFMVLSTLMLLLPVLSIGVAVQHPDTPYTVMLGLSALCGLGGASFASSMTHLSLLFPRGEVGSALSLNSGLGNLGLSLTQFVVPFAITLPLFGAIAGGPQAMMVHGVLHPAWLQNAGFVWVPLIVLCALVARFGMYDLPSPHRTVAEEPIFTQRRYWMLSFLYLGTFGSLVGYTAAFPLVATIQFPDNDVIQYVFLPPLLGALARPLGGWLANRHGGGKVTVASFALMVLSILACLAFLPSGSSTGNFWGVLTAFSLLFFAAGLGSGSMFFLVPDLDNREAPVSLAHRNVRVVGRAIGMISAVGALGGVVIPMVLALMLTALGGVQGAFLVFVLFYLLCMVCTWWCHVRERPHAET